jgi:alanine-synthesizing transaminase
VRLSRRTAFASPTALSAWLRARPKPSVDLSESNPTRCGFLQPEAVALLGDRGGVGYAPDPRGDRGAREAVARYYRRRAVEVDPDCVVLTTSSSEAYGWLFKLLCDPGDAVLAPTPSYPLFPLLARLEGVDLQPYRLAPEEGFRIDRGDLLRAVDARSRAVLAVSPANPTGHYLHDEDAAYLETLADERDLSIVVDEVFHDFYLGPHPASIARRPGERTFVISGLSKVALLPQLKLGWIVARSRAALARLELVADGYLSVSTAVQRAAPTILDGVDALQEAVRSRLGENLAALDAAIAHQGASCPVRRLPVAGGWYALVEVPRTRSDEAWVRRLVELDDIGVQPGYFYDLDADGVMVVSLLLTPEVFLDAIGRALARWVEA